MASHRISICIFLLIISLCNFHFAIGQIVGHGRPGTTSDYSLGYAGVDSRGPYGGAIGNGRYFASGTDENGRPYGIGGQGGFPGQPGYPGYPGYGGQPGYAGSPYSYDRYPGDYRYRYLYGSASSHLLSFSLLLSSLLALQMLWKIF